MYSTTIVGSNPQSASVHKVRGVYLFNIGKKNADFGCRNTNSCLTGPEARTEEAA